MAGSIDYVLQPDGTYKWEVAELKPKVQETAETCPAPEPKATKKKPAKKKTDSPLSE
jgi:hypothetical protein